MKYSLSLREDQLKQLTEAFTNEQNHERAAYIFCSVSITESEKRFIVSDIEVIMQDGIADSSPTNIAIRSTSYVSALVKAEREQKHFFLVHSHPGGYTKFSDQDDHEEAALFKTVFYRCPDGPHGSLVIAGLSKPILFGRVWINGSKSVMLDKIRVVGNRLRMYEEPSVTSFSWADRQVKAFGKDAQNLINSLHIGLVGAGGTGSAVAEQLIRIGIKEITVIDPDIIDETNVTRIYGSSLNDVGKPKVAIVAENAKRIGLGTKINALQCSILDKKSAMTLRDCDVIFGCTDDHAGRFVLTRFPYWYYIPVIDMGVLIDSQAGKIRDITGRVTIITPGSPCLNCRGTIIPENAHSEILKYYNPKEHAKNIQEGYVPELGVRDPSVVMFTTSVAARAVCELFHLITGYMGEEKISSEVRERFHVNEITIRKGTFSQNCICSKMGLGDSKFFLGRTWR